MTLPAQASVKASRRSPLGPDAAAGLPKGLALDLPGRFSEQGIEGVVGQPDATIGVQDDQRLADRLDDRQRVVARLDQFVAVADEIDIDGDDGGAVDAVVAGAKRQYAQHPPSPVAIADVALPGLHRARSLGR